MKNKVASEPASVFNGNNKETKESPLSMLQNQASIIRIVRIIEEKIIWRIVGVSCFSTTIIFTVFTYFKDDSPDWLHIINMIILALFLIDYILRLYISSHKIFFLTSAESFRDFVIVLPLLFPHDPGSQMSVFITTTSYFVRSIVAVNVTFKTFRIVDSDVSRQIIMIVLTLCQLMYISAGVFMAAENLDKSIEEKLKFHQCVYFVTVTLSTVGYGDISPHTELGRIIVIIMIVLTIAIIPKQTGELLRLLGMQSIYARAIYKSNSEIPHIICTGQITFDALKNWCDDLFHEDHGIEAKMLIILQPGDPNSTLEVFLNGNKYKYELFISFLNGDPLSTSGLK